ncbi:MAG: hypothetical protein AAFY84_11060 [Pseudomonadota bacterium]
MGHLLLPNLHPALEARLGYVGETQEWREFIDFAVLKEWRKEAFRACFMFSSVIAIFYALPFMIYKDASTIHLCVLVAFFGLIIASIVGYFAYPRISIESMRKFAKETGNAHALRFLDWLELLVCGDDKVSDGKEIPSDDWRQAKNWSRLLIEIKPLNLWMPRKWDYRKPLFFLLQSTPKDSADEESLKAIPYQRNIPDAENSTTVVKESIQNAPSTIVAPFDQTQLLHEIDFKKILQDVGRGIEITLSSTDISIIKTVFRGEGRGEAMLGNCLDDLSPSGRNWMLQTLIQNSSRLGSVSSPTVMYQNLI